MKTIVFVFSFVIACPFVSAQCYFEKKQLAREAELRGRYDSAIWHLEEAARCPELLPVQCYQIIHRIKVIRERKERMVKHKPGPIRNSSNQPPKLTGECTDTCFRGFINEGDRLFKMNTQSHLEDAKKMYRAAKYCNAGEIYERLITKRIHLADLKIEEIFKSEKEKSDSLANKNRSDSYGYKSRELLRKGERNAAFLLAWFASRQLDSVTNPIVLQTLFSSVYLEDQPEYAANRQPFYVELPAFQHEVRSLLFSPNNNYLALWDGNNISIWNISTLKQEWQYPMKNLQYWKFSSYGSYLVTADSVTLTVLNIYQREEAPQRYKVLSGHISAAGFSKADEERVLFKIGNHWYRWDWKPRISGYQNRNARPVLEDDENCSEEYNKEIGPSFSIAERLQLQTSIRNQVERKGKMLLVASTDITGVLRVRAKAKMGEPIYNISLTSDDNDHLLFALTPNGSFLAVCLDSVTIRIYDLNLRNGWSRHIVIPRDTVSNPVFLADNGRYALYDSAHHSMKIVIDGYPDYSIKPPTTNYERSRFDVGEDFLIFRHAKDPGALALYHFQEKGESKKILLRDSAQVACLALNPDNRFVAVGDVSGAIFLYDVLDRSTQPVKMDSLDQIAKQLLFSPDGKNLAAILSSATRQSPKDVSYYLKIWFDWANNQSSNTAIIPLLGNKPNQASFSPDGQYLAIACNEGTVQVFRILPPAIKEAAVFYGGKSVFQSVAIGASAEGETWVAAGDLNGAVRIWNLQRQEILVFQAHNTTVQQLAFSLDNNYLYTLANMEPVKYWALRPELLEKIVLNRTDRLPPMPSEYAREFEIVKDLPHLTKDETRRRQLSRFPFSSAVLHSIFQDYASRTSVSFDISRTIPDACRYAEKILKACDTIPQAKLMPLLADMFADWSLKSLLQGQKDSAIILADKAYGYAPTTNAERTLALCLVANGRLEEALPLYARDIYLNPEDSLGENWSDLENEFFNQNKDRRWKDMLEKRIAPPFNNPASTDPASASSTDCVILGYALLRQQNNAMPFEWQIIQLESARQCLERFRGQHPNTSFNHYYEKDLKALYTNLFRLYFEYARFDNRCKDKREKNFAFAVRYIDRGNITPDEKTTFYYTMGQLLKNDSLMEKATRLARKEKNDFILSCEVYLEMARNNLLQYNDTMTAKARAVKAQSWYDSASIQAKPVRPALRPSEQSFCTTCKCPKRLALIGDTTAPRPLPLGNILLLWSRFAASSAGTSPVRSVDSTLLPLKRKLLYVRFLMNDAALETNLSPFDKAIIASDLHFLPGTDKRKTHIDSLFRLDSIHRIEYDYFKCDFLTNEYFARLELDSCLYFSERRFQMLDTLVRSLPQEETEETRYWKKTLLERMGSLSYHYTFFKKYDKSIQLADTIFQKAKSWNLDTLDLYWELVNLGNAYLLKGDTAKAKEIYDNYIETKSSRDHRTDEILKDWRDLTRLGVPFPDTAVLRKWYFEWTGLEMPEEDYHLYGITKGSR